MINQEYSAQTTVATNSLVRQCGGLQLLSLDYYDDMSDIIASLRLVHNDDILRLSVLKIFADDRLLEKLVAKDIRIITQAITDVARIREKHFIEQYKQ